jgi:hypothetical protein
MEMILIKPDSTEWNNMWQWVAEHPLNQGIEEPTVAFNELNGEQWQYMGSFRSQDGRVVHSFRHRSHPLDNELKTLSMNATETLTEADIEKVIPIK